MDIVPREEIAAIASVIRGDFGPHMLDHMVALADALDTEDFDAINFHMVQLAEHHTMLVEAVAAAAVSQVAHRAIDNEVDGFDVPDDLSELGGD